MIRKMIIRAAVVGAARYGTRVIAGRRVDSATDRVNELLPAPVADVVPDGVLRAAGTAVVAIDGARKAGKVSKTAGGGVIRTGRAVQRVGQSGASVVDRGRSVVAPGVSSGVGVVARARRAVGNAVGGAEDQFRTERTNAERSARADWLRYSGRPDAATDAMLDLRGEPESVPPTPVPDPIPTGRLKRLESLPAPPIPRVQRTYRRPRKPWDR